MDGQLLAQVLSVVQGIERRLAQLEQNQRDSHAELHRRVDRLVEELQGTHLGQEPQGAGPAAAGGAAAPQAGQLAEPQQVQGADFAAAAAAAPPPPPPPLPLLAGQPAAPQQDAERECEAAEQSGGELDGGYDGDARDEGAAEAAAADVAVGEPGAARTAGAGRHSVAGQSGARRRVQPEPLGPSVEQQQQALQQDEEHPGGAQLGPPFDEEGNSWYFWSLPRRRRGPLGKSLPRRLWLQAGLADLAPTEPEGGSGQAGAAQAARTAGQEQRPQAGEWPVQVATNNKDCCGKVPAQRGQATAGAQARTRLDRLAERVRARGYAQRVQRQWKRELTANDRELLEDVEEGEEGEEEEEPDGGDSEAEDEVPRFRILQAEELEGEEEGPVSDGEEADVLPVYGESEGDYEELSDDEPDLPPGGEDDVRRDARGEGSDAEEEGDTLELEDLLEEKALAQERLLRLLRLAPEGAAADAAATDELRRHVVAQIEHGLDAAPSMNRSNRLRSLRMVVEVLSGVAVGLEAQALGWEQRELPKLTRRGHHLWRQGRDRAEVRAWREGLVDHLARLVKLVVEVIKTHTEGRSANRANVQRACGSLEATYHDILTQEECLRIAALPQQPERVAEPPRGRGARPGAAGGRDAGGAAAGKEECSLGAGADGDGFLATGSESEGMSLDGGDQEGSSSGEEEEQERGKDASAGGRGVPGRRTCAGGQGRGEAAAADVDMHDAEAAGAGEGAPQPSGAPKQEGLWNLAGLRPNETQVLVAPGMVPQQRQQAQRGEAPGSGGEPAVQGGADVVAVAGREGAGEQAAAAATPEASQAEGGTAAAGSSGAELAAAGSGTVSDRAAAAQPSGWAEQGGGLAGRDAPPEALAPPGSGPPMQLAASDRTVSDRQEERAGPRRPVAHADSNQTVSEHASAPLAAPLAAQQQPQRIAASDQQHSAAPSAVGSAGRAPGAEAVVERAPAAAVAEQRLEEMEGEHSMEMVGVGASADDAHMPQATGSEVESVDVESVEVDMPAGRLSNLERGAGVEVRCVSDDGGPCWAQAYLAARVIPTATSARVDLLGDGDQLRTEEVALESVRPCRGGAAAAALQPSALRVGQLYELELLQDPSQRWAKYVPAVLVGKRPAEPVLRFLPEEAPEEGLGPLDGLLHRCTLEAERLAAAGTAEPLQAPACLWLLPQGADRATRAGNNGATSELVEVVYNPSDHRPHPVVRPYEAWLSRADEWHPALELQTAYEVNLAAAQQRAEAGEEAVEGEATAEEVELEYTQFTDLRISLSDYGRLRYAASRQRSALLQQQAYAALQQRREAAQGGRAPAMTPEEAEEDEQRVTRGLQSWFRTRYLARNPCTDLSRILAALGMQPSVQPSQTGARQRGEKDQFVLVSGRRAAGAPRFRSLVQTRKGKRQREATELDAAKDAQLARQNQEVKERLQRLLERDQKRQKTRAQAAFTSPAIVNLDSEDVAAVPLFPDQASGRAMVPTKMAQALKEHQWEGVRFVWDTLVTDYEAEDAIVGGAILAHHMGLGKSLQTIVFLHCFHALHPNSRSLVIVPKNVKINWHDEFKKWLPMPLLDNEEGFAGLTPRRVWVYKGEHDVRGWYRQSAGVLVMTYEEFRKLVLPPRKRKRKQSAAEQSAASAPAAPSTAPVPGATADGDRAAAAAAAPAIDRGASAPGELSAEAANGVVGSTGGGGAGEEASTESGGGGGGGPGEASLVQMLTEGPAVVVVDEGHVIKNPKGRLREALCKIRTTRRLALTGYPLQNNLLEMYAMVSWCDDTVLGDQKWFQDTFVMPIQEGQLPGATPGAQRRMCQQLSVLHDLTDRIVHRKGEELLRVELPCKQEHIIKLQLSAAQQAVYKAYLEGVESCQSCFRDRERLNDLCDRPSSFKAWLQTLCVGPAQQAAGDAAADAQGNEEKPANEEQAADVAEERQARKKPIPMDLARRLLDMIEAAEAEGEEFSTAATAKMWALRRLVRYCLAHREQLIVVSERLETIKAVEGLLEEEEGLRGGERIFWRSLTGERTAAERQGMVGDLHKGKLQFLLLSKAGSHGINLVSCQRVVVLDEPWNPVYNAQAIARVFRYGQERPTFVYRLCYNGAMQYNIYLRNVNKEALFRRVVDRQTVKSKAINEEQLSIYCYKPDPLNPGLEALAGQPDMDAAIRTLVEADALEEGGPRIADVEDHDKNLADDPSQRLTAKDKQEAAVQFCAQTTAGGRGGADMGVMTRNQMRRLRKLYPGLNEEEILAYRGQLLVQQQQQAEGGAQHTQQQQQPAGLPPLAPRQQQQQPTGLPPLPRPLVRVSSGSVPAGPPPVAAATPAGGQVPGQPVAPGSPSGLSPLAVAVAASFRESQAGTQSQQGRKPEGPNIPLVAGQQAQQGAQAAQQAQQAQPSIASGMSRSVFRELRRHLDVMKAVIARGGSFAQFVGAVATRLGSGSEAALWQGLAAAMSTDPPAVKALFRQMWASQCGAPAPRPQQAQQLAPALRLQQLAPAPRPQQAQQAASGRQQQQRTRDPRLPAPAGQQQARQQAQQAHVQQRAAIAVPASHAALGVPAQQYMPTIATAIPAVPVALFPFPAPVHQMAIPLITSTPLQLAQRQPQPAAQQRPGQQQQQQQQQQAGSRAPAAAAAAPAAAAAGGGGRAAAAPPPAPPQPRQQQGQQGSGAGGNAAAAQLPGVGSAKRLRASPGPGEAGQQQAAGQRSGAAAGASTDAKRQRTSPGGGAPAQHAQEQPGTATPAPAAAAGQPPARPAPAQQPPQQQQPSQPNRPWPGTLAQLAAAKGGAAAGSTPQPPPKREPQQQQQQQQQAAPPQAATASKEPDVVDLTGDE